MSRRARRLAAARVARVRCVCRIAALGERARRLQAAGEVQRIHRWRGELCHKILYGCTRGRLLTRRLASGCIQGPRTAQRRRFVSIAQSLTPHGYRSQRRRKHEPAVGRGPQPSPARLGTHPANVRGSAGLGRRRQNSLCTGARGGGGGLPTASETAQKSVHKKAHRPSTGAGQQASQTSRARSPAAEDGQDRRHTH